MRLIRVRTAIFAVALVAVCSSLGAGPAEGAGAAQPNTVLILGSTATSGLESAKATALGYNVEIANTAQWAAKSTADFATYRAIVLGDPTCATGTGPVAAAQANRTVWSPAITGNMVIIGTDPAFHSSQGGAQLTESGIKFAADEPGKTGAYITLSCYYFNVGAAGTPVPLLDQFGTFTVRGQFTFGGCPARSHIVASHPALAGTTDATLSNWGCSAHEAFVMWPSNFQVLVISTDVPGDFTAGDGTSGMPYIVARGETLVPAACGDGNLDPGEECDDGNTTNGDGCSAQCKIEVVTNNPPVAQCKNVTVPTAGGTCGAAASVDNGSSDPDGDPITLSQSPAGPYGLGSTSVTLTVTDPSNASSQCSAAVTVVDQAKPQISCPAPVTAECTGGQSASATFSASATDNCPAVSVSCPASGSSFPLGTTSVSCSATDSSGNSASCTSAVSIVDTKAPAITCPAPVTVECTENGSATATLTATAADVCDGTVPASCGGSPSSFPLGTTTVQCSASDASANRASCPASVTVVDTTPPTVACVPSFNPSGKHIPVALNEDGFYKVSGSDSCTSAGIRLGGFALANGETIKLTQTPGKSGVRFVGTMGPAAIKHFQVGPADAVIVATDGSGNQSSVTCLVPPPPK